MENSKFGGANISLSIPMRLGALNIGARIDVTLANGERVQGLVDSFINGDLVLTLVGANDKKMIKVDEITELVIPQLGPKAR